MKPLKPHQQMLKVLTIFWLACELVYFTAAMYPFNSGYPMA